MKKTIAIVSVLVIVFLCSSPVFASTVSIEERFNTTDVFLQDPDDTDKKLVVNTYNSISRPYYVSYDYDFAIGREYYGTSSMQYPANPYNWQSSDISHLYQVDYSCTVTISNRHDYLTYGDIGYISVLPNFTYQKSPACYWVECVTEGMVLSDITNNGTLKFRYAPSDYSYYGRVAVPGNGAINVTFIIHFMYSDYYNYQNGNVISNGGTLFGSSVNYMDITSVSLVQPSDWVLTNVDVNANHLVNEWTIVQWLKIISNKMNDERQGYIDVRDDSASVESNSSSAQSQSEQNHQTELSYFNQTNTALNNTGITNYQFDNEQVGGIGSVSNDFTSVWNALGSWTSVYIFSLTLSLGLAIIRHVRPIQRSKEE